MVGENCFHSTVSHCNLYVLTTASKQINVPVGMLALLVAIGMSAIDFYYASNDTIRNIYMADGAVEILFTILWMMILIKIRFHAKAQN